MRLVPMIPNRIEEGHCPYCYDGTLAYDKYSKRIYCKRCNKAVKCDGID